MQHSNADLLEIKSPTNISRASRAALMSSKSKGTVKDSLFGQLKHKNEISIQTDQQSYVGGTLKKALDTRTDLDSQN